MKRKSADEEKEESKKKKKTKQVNTDESDEEESSNNSTDIFKIKKILFLKVFQQDLEKYLRDEYSFNLFDQIDSSKIEQAWEDLKTSFPKKFPASTTSTGKTRKDLINSYNNAFQEKKLDIVESFIKTGVFNNMNFKNEKLVKKMDNLKNFPPALLQKKETKVSMDFTKPVMVSETGPFFEMDYSLIENYEDEKLKQLETEMKKLQENLEIQN
jgi:hypothetical protein